MAMAMGERYHDRFAQRVLELLDCFSVQNVRRQTRQPQPRQTPASEGSPRSRRAPFGTAGDRAGQGCRPAEPPASALSRAANQMSRWRLRVPD